MLNRTDNESEASGLLIDFDLSVETEVTQGRVQAVREPKKIQDRRTRTVCFFT
jgi:hypothetical protein